MAADRAGFSRALTSKLLTYALGRGLERYDTKTVKAIADRLPAQQHRVLGPRAGDREEPAVPVAAAVT